MDAMQLAMTVTLLLCGWSWLCRASPSNDPWAQCPSARICRTKFADGTCDKECSAPECLKDGFDCLSKTHGECMPKYKQYCRDHYGNSYCEKGCSSAPCGWDGSDCLSNQRPLWARGTLILHTHIPAQDVPSQNSSLLWALSILLQTVLKLRGVAPFHSSRNLFTLDSQELADLLTLKSTRDNNGSLWYLQVDNRPCSSLPSTCFPVATEAANFLHTMMTSKHSQSSFPEVRAVIAVRGVTEELGERDVDTQEEEVNTTPSWIWAVIGVAAGLGLALAILVIVLLRRARQCRADREAGQRVRHRSTVTDSDHRGQSWAQHIPHRDERTRVGREKERNGLKKKKKGKENGKKRREPLGEDAIRLRPLKKELDIGSDTDITQSSMEDINMRCSQRQGDDSICDHRPQEQKNFRVSASHSQSPTQAPPGGWERNTAPPHNRMQNSAPVQWCGPDGSVVLIRAVRSGLDRVVLELLRAGVPVNNTDHTGRSALHWACSVNHLSLARTLIRYGAAVDLQDYKGETALFLSALNGCYDTARFLLLHGANQDLADRRGRRPLDAAREGLHHHVLELLLAHRTQRGPPSMDTANDMSWEDRALYSQWVAQPGLPGRSASFSGVIGHRETLPPHCSDWSAGRDRCASPQEWRPPPYQTATALVSPRILGRPSRPISTLQEVTSEAEEEDAERLQEAARAATPHFLSPQPAPRQRSFSCTQHALRRRSSDNQFEQAIAASAVKPAKEPVEIVVSSPAPEAPSHLEVKGAADLPSKVQSDSESGSSRNCNQKTKSEKISYTSVDSETSAHTAL
ncbi:hypothetical protein MATL_G00130560 [Megalops atlanticus]|uniref:LNR domain-containing protein n=1 Tax=Megalops atlanticus TaxID=7932 RepID=A0A9D3Q088_MEGAT|nr:hypothetical protein MATL_G00130560 [Megalops atlanticus]